MSFVQSATDGPLRVNLSSNVRRIGYEEFYFS